MEALQEIGGIFLSMSLLAAFGVKGEHNKQARQAILSLGAQVASHVVAVLRLVQGGLDVQARIISRSCIEAADLMVACQIDDQLAAKFVACESAEEANGFWYSEVAKGRLEKGTRGYFEKQFPTLNESRREFASWRADEMRAMGWAVHPSHMSGVASLLEMRVDSPGTEEVETKEAALERDWSVMSSRTLDFLLACLGSALVDLNLVAARRFGGLKNMLKLPRKKLPPDVRLMFAAGQRHLKTVAALTTPTLLNAPSITKTIRQALKNPADLHNQGLA
ncbi:hypothetical protein [Brevundimonas sp.]|uniref:hypothetical protein n=1 Tax=Brevundimonas sp. TaxID=1871086 RepID=UPI001AC61420|nr:hypothetical protein [Brevundimonas sp.]MBN9466428.1 hypothetical protein [Brevundimonas sp.]